MLNEIMKLICIYLISFGALLILIEVRAHLEKSFLVFGIFLVSMNLFTAVDFWGIFPGVSGQEHLALLIVQHFLVSGSAIALLWYFVLLSETAHRRFFILASIVAVCFALSFLFLPYFRVDRNSAGPTLLYLVAAPLFFLSFSAANIALLLRGLRTLPQPQKQRVLKFHLLGYALLLISGSLDFVIFGSQLEPFVHILPNGTIFGLVLYGGLSTIVFTDRIVDLIAEKNQFSQLAQSDALTDVGNRRMLSVLLGHGLDFADQSRQPFSAIVLDIDAFKTYNDSYGHAVGDEILRQVVDQIRAAIRPNDALMRYGGDEFVVLCPDTDAPQVMAIGGRICAHIREHHLAVQGHDLRVTVSVGCATYPTHTTLHDQLVNCADKAQYVSKQNGKNRVTLAS